MPTIRLTLNGDTWSTTSGGAFVVFGRDGDDSLRIRTSRMVDSTFGDRLSGGEGNDYLGASVSNDFLFGGSGSDTLL